MIPLYCLIVAVWTTVMSELWKRRNAELAYRWDVVNYVAEEPSRPECAAPLRPAAAIAPAAAAPASRSLPPDCHADDALAIPGHAL